MGNATRACDVCSRPLMRYIRYTMVTVSPDSALYPSRSGAGAQLGNQLSRRTTPPTVIIGITPTGVEVAANAAKAMGCEFDVIVAAHVRFEGLGIIENRVRGEET